MNSEALIHDPSGASEERAQGMAPIAIVGLGAMYPGSTSTLGFWRDIWEGRDRLTDVPHTHWLPEDYFDPRPGTPDKVYSTRGGFLPEIPFSPIEFGIPPNTVPATDTAQLLALVVAKRLLDDVIGARRSPLDRSKVSVILGVASATELVGHMAGRLQKPIWQRAMREAGLAESDVLRISEHADAAYVPWQENTFPGVLGNVVAGRIANRLDLGGTNAVVDAACASSLAAVAMAVNELALGHSDLVITGGVDALNDIFMYMCFAQTGALSHSGDCRPFSGEADGTILGEGIGMLALRRLADAERDGDKIYAVLRGIGSSSDGRAKSIYTPSADGQTLALERAYRRAGYGPETVGLVEAHGTGTRAGDAAEFEALRQVFTAAGAKPQACALGSVKSQIGHTKAAAGAAGLIKAVLALHHRVLPATIKVTTENPALELATSPFYLNTEQRPWVQPGGHPRRASVSALGFGGTNFHVTLEEYVGPSSTPERLHTSPSELLLLGAETPEALAAQCRDAVERCHGEGTLARLAREQQLTFSPSPHARVAVVASDEADAREKLQLAAESILKNGETPFHSPRGISYGTGSRAGEVALLFSGQGSQYVGMGRELSMQFDCVREVWDRASEEIRDAQVSLGSVVYPQPARGDAARAEQERTLTATQWAQPAIAAMSLGLLQLLERVGVAPAMVGGHSLGEVTALTASGALERGDGLRVARQRGELMAHASDVPGAMTAVSAAREEVERLVLGMEVVLANHNDPQQVVLSGSVAAIEGAERSLEAAGLRVRRLSVSTAFHSPLVAAAVEPFRAFLDRIPVQTPSVPCYANASAAEYPAEPDQLRAQLAAAVSAPVRFVEQVEAMYAAGARVFIEVGPDAVLTRLTQRCLMGRPHLAVALDQRGKDGVTAWHSALGQLAAHGYPLTFAGLWEGRQLAEMPSVKGKGTIMLTGANHAKPYPPAVGARVFVRETNTLPSASVTRVPAIRAKSGEPAMAVSSVPPTASEAPIAPSTRSPSESTFSAAPVPLDWVDAIQRLQAPTIAAQMDFQRAMAESHQAFLRAVESSFASLGLRIDRCARGRHRRASLAERGSRTDGGSSPTPASARTCC
ncbi:MAG: beta-ketoacyl synthase N-terminal-like domain-containing protein [Myxococcales bacterium]